MKKKNVSPIPKGYPVLSPHLSVKGATGALEFYKKAFGAKERMRIPGPDGTLGHAEIDLNGAVVMLADEFPGCGTGSPATLNGTSVTMMLYVKDVDAAFARAARIVEAIVAIVRPGRRNWMLWERNAAISTATNGRCWREANACGRPRRLAPGYPGA